MFYFEIEQVFIIFKMKHPSTFVLLFSFIYTGASDDEVCLEDRSMLYPNLALNKPATQSSLYDGSYDNGLQGFAWRANDGNKNGNYRDKSCSHAALILDNHWWQVDLEGLYNVTSVTIVNRDKLASRLRDFGIEVSLSDQDDGNGHLQGALQCHYHTGAGIGNSEERAFRCTPGAIGQHVRIYMPSFSSIWEALTLCEVAVSGYKMNCYVPTTSSLTTTEITTSSPTTTELTTTSQTTTEITTSSLTTTELTTTSQTTIEITTSSPTTTEVTTSSPLTTEITTEPAPTTALCVCSCVNKTVPTKSELVERVEQLKKTLTVDKKTTNSYQRKFTSAPDSRSSARNIGVVLGAGILVFVFGSLIALDIPRVIDFFRCIAVNQNVSPTPNLLE